MNNIYLKFPTIEDKEKWLEYLKEYRLDNPNEKPLGCTETLNYEEWLVKINKDKDGIDLVEGRVPSTVYFLMKNHRIVGNLSIRHNINNEFLSLYGGHIGYSVRPSERRKGYATMMLHLAIEKCKELGLSDVLVTCRETNVGSAKTIENNFGVQTEILYIPREQCYFKKYWINVDESLKKFDIEKNVKHKNL